MTRYDGDTERTFAALPPASGRGFARTWWGQAWLKALEDTALDNAQLKAGRRLARAGAVGAVSVRPGRLTAVVHDRDRTPHRADVLLEQLSPAQWDRLLDMTVERAGHVAALLDREMPPHLVEDAAAEGVDLLPGLGDLEPECDCGAWDHCGHTAALCYQVARLLDQDPFVLLLMRGRAEDGLLEDLQRRSGASTAESTGPEGVDAAEAYAAGDILPPLPDLPALPDEPGASPSLDTETAPGPGVDPVALEFLAATTAGRAHGLLREALRGGFEPELTTAQDAVRLAAGPAGQEATADPWKTSDPRKSSDPRETSDPRKNSDPRETSDPQNASASREVACSRAVTDRLADGSGRGREGLAAAVRAWRHGGAEALSVLDEEWRVEGEALARARAALESAWDADERPELRARANRWTAVGAPVQLRLGRDGRWWPYRKENGRWLPAGAATRDPATALASASAEPTGDAATPGAGR
ncbi:SWF or SNF family helicase [Streptomyces sp. NPDC029554]|uniref:SWIM zinc finger family protein n=1 Tax=Streptomyces sp. NPDC029554 TaxID=3155126 RepID=UPI0033DFC90B